MGGSAGLDTRLPAEAVTVGRASIGRPVRAVGLAGALAVLAGAPVAGGSEPAPSSYQAAAAADGVRVGTAIPGAPVADTLVDLSTGSAQAVVDGLGTSRAFAAAPYPGAATTLPDTVRASGGPPLPSYPFIASSQAPTNPESTVNQPGLRLEARSGPDDSSAWAVTGAEGAEAGALGRGLARVRTVVADDGEVIAEASSELAGLVVGPIALGRVTSAAKVTRGGGGEPRREQSLEVGGLTIAGQGLAIGPGGLSLPGAAVPLPDTHPLRAVLERAGVSVQYLEATETPDGVVAPGLLVTQAIPASLTGSPSRITYLVGRASASVQAAAGPGASELGVELPPAEEAPITGTAPEDPLAPLPATTLAAPTLGGAASFPSVPDGVAAPTTPDATSEAAATSPAPETAAATNAAPEAAAALPAATSRPPGTWSNGIYLALIVTGVLLLAAFLVVRALGVKTVWVS